MNTQRLYSEAQMKDCWEACDAYSFAKVYEITAPDRDQYLSTVKPVEVMKWVEVKDGLPDKEGYYVTVNEWVGGGPIVPYDRSDTYFKDGVFFAGKDWVVLEWLLEPTLATDKK